MPILRGMASGMAVVSLVVSSPASAAAQRGDARRLAARIDSLATAELAAGPTAGLSIAMVRGRDTIIARGYGFADLEHHVPATARTVYRLGSITKQFTALAILQLAEQGKLTLDDELTRFLPNYPTQGHRVTIRHLLTHISGIKSYTGLGPEFWDKARLDLSHEQMLALFKDKPFDFAPGERFLYNNSGYYLLGMIIEQVTGRSYAEHLRDQVFRPLGLSRTSYCDERTIVEDRAQGYARAECTLVNDDPLSMRSPFSAGALCSTVLDLVAWQRSLVAHRLISAASYRLMTTPALLNDGSKTSYGFGLAPGELSGHARVGHGGGINGFNTQLDYYPDDSLIVAVLANTEGANPGRLAGRIARLVLGIAEPVVKDLPLTAAERARYVGTYQLGPLQLRVFEVGDSLMTQASGQGAFRLKAQGGHVFVASFDNDSRLVFELDAGKGGAGRAVALMLHQGGTIQRGPRVGGGG